jgi:hypothetical protein
VKGNIPETKPKSAALAVSRDEAKIAGARILRNEAKFAASPF